MLICALLPSAVEFGVLSRLTGDPQFERVALKALESLWRTRSSLGLVGNHINVQTEYKSAINRYVRKVDWFMWVTMTKGAVSLPIFQSLEAFWPGLLTMIGNVEDASRIMLQYSQVIRQYGFPPEFYNIDSSMSDKRTAFPLRPEMVESLMYLYRATEDPQFLEIAAQIVDAIEHSAKTPCGYATINNVNDHSIEDRMESFFLAETTKYLYLIFDQNNFLHNDGQKARIVDTPNGECVVDAGGYIFNTEAHPIDPAIVHCCSAQRQAEREAVRKWEDNYDLLTILDHRDTVSPMLLRK
ncbi:glycosyl hydrolase family 47, partial [Teladorsagia circumcincta]